MQQQLRIIRFGDLIEVPWKNGAGITRDIAYEQGVSGLLWRLSLADMDRDAEFSGFAGLTRILTVVKGGGLVVSTPHAELLASPAVPLRFEGGVPARGMLRSGPVRNFNLMFDPGRITARVWIMQGCGDTHQWHANETHALHVISGEADAGGHPLRPGDTVIGRALPGALQLPKDTVSLAIGLRPADQSEARSSAMAPL